ncbi:MAG: ATP-binding protein, partial [Desulfamplus sp.]|nr:ATP-binding protein [Desulfamplus sp.]
LTTITQYNLASAIKPAWYIEKDGSLNISKLLQGFQEFFRENSEIWLERFQYKEAAPQLLLQAFLQRIVNGGGRVEREYGLGRMRTDLLVIWNHGKGVQKVVIELKILYKSLEKTIKEGLKQTLSYMDRCGTVDGNLLIFDRTEDKSWEEKIFYKEEKIEGKVINVFGM